MSREVRLTSGEDLTVFKARDGFVAALDAGQGPTGIGRTADDALTDLAERLDVIAACVRAQVSKS